MAPLAAILATVVALSWPLATARNFIAPVSVPDPEPTEIQLSSATSLNRERPTALSVPPPVLDTATFDDLAGNTTSFTLQDMISFFTGTKNSITSNFTLFAPNSASNTSTSPARSAKVIATDRFVKALNSAKCTNSSVLLTFTDTERYKAAQKEWKWVNQKREHHVYMVTKNQECDRGADDPEDLQLWAIKEVKFNNFKKSVTMVGTAVEFMDVFKEWRLKASNTGIMAKRKGIDGAEGVHGRDMVSKGQIDLDYQISPKFGLAFGGSPPRPLLPTDPDHMMTGALFCETCSIYGTFDWDLDIGRGSLSDLRPLKGVISLTARNVGAMIQPKLALYEGTEVIDHEIEIWGKAIPRSGIYKRGLFDIGATVHLIFKIKLQKTPVPMAMMAGFNVSLADEAVVKIDLGNPEKSVVNGWKPSIDSLEPYVSSNSSMTAIMGPRLMLSYGAEVIGQGAQVGIVFAGGNLELKVKTDDKSSCSKEAAARGVSFEGGLVNEVAAYGTAKLISSIATTTTLASTSKQLFSTCKTIDASLLGTRHRPTQLHEHFTPEIVAKLASVTAAVGSLASKASEAITSIASEASETAASVIDEVKTEGSEVIAGATSAVGGVISEVGDVVGDVLHIW